MAIPSRSFENGYKIGEGGGGSERFFLSLAELILKTSHTPNDEFPLE